MGIEGGLRHDLSPVDTSQVAAVLGGDEAVGGEDIEPAVVVEVGEGGAPGPAGHGGFCLDGDVGEAAFSVGGEEGVAASHAAEGGAGFFVAIEFFEETPLSSDAVAGAGEHVGDVEVHPAVAVKVAPVGGHAGGGVFDAKLGGDVDEEGELAGGLGTAILVEAVSAEVVGDVEVEVAVLVVVFPGGGEGEAGVVLVEAGLGGDVFEGPVALVLPEDIGAAVVGVVEGDGFAEGSGASFGVGGIVAADVDIEEAVLIEVGGGDGEGLSFGADAEGELEVALAVHVFHEEEFEILGDDEVLVAVIIEVEEEGGGAEVHPVGFRFGGEVGESAVGVLEEEEIWKAALLAEVEVFEAIAIDIAEGESVICGGVEAEVAGEALAPVVGGAEELGLVGGIFFEGGGGDIGEELLGGGLGDFFVVAEGDCFEEGGSGGGPNAVPVGVDLEEGGFEGDQGPGGDLVDVGDFDFGFEFGFGARGDF